jgi:hypothetical protein
MKKKTWLLIPAVLLLLLAAAMFLLHRAGAQPVESKPAGAETITQTTTTIHPTTTLGSTTAGTTALPTTVTQTTAPATVPTTVPPASTPAATQPTVPVTDPAPCSHNWSNWTTQKEATCTTDGSEERFCSKCGEKEQRGAEALGHDWDEGTVTVAPQSCSDIGQKRHTCRRCGENKTEQINGTHTFDEWKYEEYTYEQDGYDRVSHRKVRTCTKCGYKEYGNTPDHSCKKGSSNHTVTTIKEGTCTTPAKMRSTCKICGWYVDYDGKKGSHTWTDKRVHLSDYGTYTNELDATVSECTSCGIKAVTYHKGEGWSDYNRYRVYVTTVTGNAYAGQPVNDNFNYIDHPEWQTVYRNFKYDSEGYVEEFTIYWWYNGSRYSQVINCGKGEVEAWFAEKGLTGEDGCKYQIRCYGTYWAPYKISWTN